MAAGSVVTVINSLDDKDISLRDINFKFYYQEAMKIINPIKLKISPKGKGKSKIKNIAVCIILFLMKMILDEKYS